MKLLKYLLKPWILLFICSLMSTLGLAIAIAAQIVSAAQNDGYAQANIAYFMLVFGLTGSASTFLSIYYLLYSGVKGLLEYKQEKRVFNILHGMFLGPRDIR